MAHEIISTYPLTGIRAATTAPQMALLEKAISVLRADDRVLAAWLVGSFATNGGDPFSDIDVHCCIEDARAEEIRMGWKELLHRITPTVMATAFPPGTIGGYALTPEWTHIDLAFHPRSRLDTAALTGLRPLFDRTGALLPAHPIPRPPGVGEPWFPAAVVDWYFYMFGNLVVVVGRNEPVLATNGIITIRDTCLVPLFCAERGIRRAGGAKRLNVFLSEEQRFLLESLPPIVPTIDAVIEAEIALARLFIPRGRALAAKTGAAWPEQLEAATLAHVARGLGITVTI
jgi:hypothetical protein